MLVSPCYNSYSAKHSTFERMSGCNYAFIIEKSSSIPLWINSIPLTSENRNDCKCLFKRNTVPLKIQDHCKWPPKIMVVPLKCMAISVSLKQKYASNGNIFHIHFIYTIYGCKCSSKK